MVQHPFTFPKEERTKIPFNPKGVGVNQQAGINLRMTREALGLSLRDVELASIKIAKRHQNDEFSLNLSRISEIETKGILPNIFKLYTLSIIYRNDIREMMAWFGVDLMESAADFGVLEPQLTHMSTQLQGLTTVRIPVSIDPGFDLRKTSNVGRIVEKWGIVPLAFLSQFADRNFTYGYIGSEDMTMYPLLMPGSFVQVDESRDTVTEGMWRSEYERPIYFVETREGYTCSWCSVRGDKITLHSHPLSPVTPRILDLGSEAEVLGQVVGVAMQLVNSVPSVRAGKGRRELA